MFFKNLQVYRFTEKPDITAEKMSIAMESFPFRSCRAHDTFMKGFTPVIGENLLCQNINSEGEDLLFCIKSEEKVIPVSSINEALAKKVAEIEEHKQRKLDRKERNEIRDEIIFEMQTRALTKINKTHAYISGDWLIVDSGSPKKSADVLILLWKALGSLPVVPISAKLDDIKPHLSSWVREGFPDGVNQLYLEDQAELRLPIGKGGAIIRFKNQDLSNPEVQEHLLNGHIVHKLGLNWRDRISFVIDDKIQLKRLWFSDIVIDQVQKLEPEDDIELFAADFAIMAANVSLLLDDLVSAVGGLNFQPNQEPEG